MIFYMFCHNIFSWLWSSDSTYFTPKDHLWYIYIYITIHIFPTILRFKYLFSCALYWMMRFDRNMSQNMITCACNFLGWIYHLSSIKFFLLHYSLLKYEYLIVNYRTSFLISTRYYILFQLLLFTCILSFLTSSLKFFSLDFFTALSVKLWISLLEYIPSFK